MKLKYLVCLLFIMQVPLLAQDAKFVESLPKDNSNLNLQNAVDFCIDEKGSLYIVDAELNVISVYNSGGILQNEIKQINGEKLFSKPISIDVVNKNQLAILNQEDKTISIVNKDLTSYYKLGRDEGDSRIEAAAAICADQYGIIYVADNVRNLILKFSFDGLYLGKCAVNSPIDIAVSNDLSLYVLSGNESSGYQVIKIAKDFISKDIINLSNLLKAEAIAVNSFGEFYICDSELGQIFKYGKNGNILGNAIGNKSSSKAPGNFSDPVSLKVFSQNNEVDNVYVLDRRFKTVQVLQVSTQIKREKTITTTPNLLVDIETSKSDEAFSSYTFSAGKDIFINNAGTAIIKDKENVIARINNINSSLPLAAQIFENNLHVLNSSRNSIDVYDASGSKIKSIGPVILNYGELENISDFVFDENGNIYIADKENNKIIIVDKLGNFVKSLNPVGMANVKEPSQLAISKSNLYILCQGQSYIFVYNIDDKNLSQIRFPYSNFEEPRDLISVTNDDIVFLHNAVNNEITIYKDGLEVSKLVDIINFGSISNMFYDNLSSSLKVARNDQNSVQSYLITFSSNQKLSIVINSLGFSELRWGSLSGQVELYKRNIGEENFSLLRTTTDTSIVLFDATNQIIEYAVKELGSDNYSNVVKDIYSFCKSIKSENPNAAVQYLKEIESLNPIIIKRELTGIYRAQADKYIANQQYTRAINALFELQKLNENSFVFYIEISQLYQRMNKLDDAIAEIETGIDRFPNNRDLIFQKIQLTIRKADYDLVINQCNDALQKFPGDEQIINVMAESFKRKSRYNEAIQYFKVLYEQTGKINYQIEIAKILEEQGKTKEAIVMYESLKDNIADKPLAIAEIANLKISGNDLPGAEKTLLEGLAEFPNNANLHFVLGHVYSKQSNKKAMDEFEKAVDLDDANPEYLLALGSEYMKYGKLDEAVFRYESALLLDENNADVLFFLGSAYLKQNKFDYAYGHLLNASRIEPENISILEKFDEAQRLREEQNKNRDIVEFNYVEIGEVSNSLLDYYDTNPFGTITLFNTRNYAISNLVITIESDIMGIEQTIVTLDSIEPNQYADISFSIKVDRDKFTEISKTKSSIMNFTLKYTDASGEDRNLVHTEKLSIK